MLRKDIKKAFNRSLDPYEASKFNAMAQAWRDPKGDFRVVHAFNEARLAWLQAQLRQLRGAKDFAHSRILDAGCATGLVSEAFARLGADVTGIDVAERNIEIGRQCAAEAGLDIDYRLATPEDMAELEPQAHDIVLALEVVEHVADVGSFTDALFRCAKPGGLVVIATLNRTWLAWLLGIFMAENVLQWLPKGTHDWRRFVTPRELDGIAAAHGFACVRKTGLGFNPLFWRWEVVRSPAVNYMVIYQRT